MSSLLAPYERYVASGEINSVVADQAEALAALSRQVMLVMELRRFALDIQKHMLERDDYERLLGPKTRIVAPSSRK